MNIFKVIGDASEHTVGGTVYTSGVVDAQGDYCTFDDLAQAKSSWERGGKIIKVMHAGEPVACRVIDSLLTSDQPVLRHGVNIPPYSWYLVLKISDESAWSRVKSGQLKGWSLGGRAVAVEE